MQMCLCNINSERNRNNQVVCSGLNARSHLIYNQLKVRIDTYTWHRPKIRHNNQSCRRGGPPVFTQILSFGLTCAVCLILTSIKKKLESVWGGQALWNGINLVICKATCRRSVTHQLQLEMDATASTLMLYLETITASADSNSTRLF